MFIIDPEPWSVPAYRIGPFRTKDIGANNRLHSDNAIDFYFKDRFKDRNFCYTIDGRSAIGKALEFYHLSKEDVVTILTTSGNIYIAKCVTDEISKTCRWSRSFESQTKVVLVNHEFGFPYSDLISLKKTGLPIIEDCAHSFFSRDENDTIGNVGDFSVYSFPKIFPIQIGGLLVSNNQNSIESVPLVNDLSLNYIKKVLSNYIRLREKIINKRIANYTYISHKFKLLGFSERFKLNNGIVPGVYMFNTGGQNIDLANLKKYFYAHGVQCSVFYGEEAFFIPVHQALNEYDMLYFYEVMKSFLKRLGL